MINQKMSPLILQKILHNIGEGIHVIDDKGISIVYNNAMSEIEGLDPKQVIGKHLLEIFPSLNEDTSTLLRALKTGEVIKEYKQSYLNFKGKQISTINTTFPIFNEENKIYGAMEIAKNITNVSHLSEQIMNLQQRLNKSKKDKLKTKKHYTFDNIIGRDKGLLKAIDFARKATTSSSSVFIFGETGTGKELFAQSIHYESDRKEKQFIAQNCAALPESLLEGILFGTSKGGFTGAIDRPGLFEQADGGTLFLDELNSMGIALQAKLLRVLQEGYVRRVGGLKDIPIDVRIIASTNENPLEAIEKGRLRKDLFYRINVINIQIPPLRHRKEDIPILVDYFIRYYNEKLNKNIWMISEELLEAFKNYSWPGNVRELQNYIESSMNMVLDEHVIRKEHLPAYAEELMNKNKMDSFDYRFRLKDFESLSDYIDKIEKETIKAVLEKTSNNISRTAIELGISRQSLQYKVKKYEL